MKSTVSVVVPVITGKDWAEHGRGLVVGGTSKAAALRALRQKGDRIMHVGGLHEGDYVCVESFRRGYYSTTADQDASRAVYRQLKELGFGDGDEVLVWCITVHPSKQEV
jgi:hypothetical protein